MRSLETFKWFGGMIAQPLRPDNLLPQHSPWGNDSLQEASHFIAPSKALNPLERIQIYHQQYWWRLLKCLQQNFPTVTRLFSTESFDQELAVPYLAAHPPSHWALSRLGETFPQWLEMHYHAQDRYLVTHAAQIDWAANHAFWVGSLPPAELTSLSVKQNLVLQPHIHLFSLEGDLLSFREVMLENPPEYYNLNPFPSIHYGDQHFVLYRTPQNVVTWKQISRAEKVTLSLFSEGNTIQGACSVLEEMKGEVLEEALCQIPFWFKQWTVLSWFGQS